jgi:hypothetical protein
MYFADSDTLNLKRIDAIDMILEIEALGMLRADVNMQTQDMTALRTHKVNAVAILENFANLTICCVSDRPARQKSIDSAPDSDAEETL